MSEQPIIVNPDSIEELVDRVFYGFHYDFINDVLTVEAIEEDEEIRLPETGFTDLDDFIAWLSSKKYLGFSWRTATSSNLVMEVS
jgi:hypothetical protein